MYGMHAFALWAPPTSPSPSARPALHRQSHGPASHTPLTDSEHRRKRKRSHSPQTSQSRLSGLSELSVPPKPRRRLLDVTPSDLEAGPGGLDTMYDSEDADLLSRADEALERLRYQSLDDFYTPADQLGKKGTPKPSHRDSNCHVHRQADLHDYSNPDLSDSDLLDSDPLDSDLLDSDPLSGQSGRQHSNVQRHHVTHIHVLSRAPAGPHLTVTSSDGDTVYLRLRDDNAKGMKPREGFHHRRGLLTVPFAELKASVEEEVRYDYPIIL